MGKKGQSLLRFLRSRKSRTASDEVKKNLPNLQDKRSAHPNDYIKSEGTGDLEMGSDARPHKIQVDYDELKITPEKILHNDVETHIMDARILSPTTRTCVVEQKNGADYNLTKSIHHNCNGNVSHDSPVTKEPPARLPPHITVKRHPSSSKMDDSFNEATLRTSYKKEFPSKKARSLPKDRERIDNDMMLTTTVQSSSDFTNGSVHPHDFATSISDQPSSSSPAERHCQKHIFVDDADMRMPNEMNRRKHSINSQRSLYRRHPPIYINDENHLDEFTPQTPWLAFTVTDKEGKGIELTIAVYGCRSNKNRSRYCGPLHLMGRPNGFQPSTSTRNHPQESRYENFSAEETHNTLDLLSGYPFIAMSPNPEAMALRYPAEEERFSKAMGGSCIKEIKGCDTPKESYKLTEDSITKLKSFFGQTKSNDPLKRTVFSSYADVRKLNELAKILERVEECPWYWGNLTGQESKKVLAGTEPGTFLLRLSSDPKYLFSLSVKTKRGPTSIRIVHENGYFRFDSELNEAQRQARNTASNGEVGTNRKTHPNYVHRITKKFTCVIHLVLYYTKHLLQDCNEEDIHTNKLTVPNDDAVGLQREDRPGELFMCYWVTRSGRKEIPVLLSTPLPRKQFFPSLQTLCRNALSKEHELWNPDNQEFVERKALPTSLRRFITQYPYPI